MNTETPPLPPGMKTVLLPLTRTPDANNLKEYAYILREMANEFDRRAAKLQSLTPDQQAECVLLSQCFDFKPYQDFLRE